MSSLSLLQSLQEIYGPLTGQQTFAELSRILSAFQAEGPARGLQPPAPLNQADALLITYPDQVNEPGQEPLASLSSFADQYLAGLVSGLHILPFFPSSSDDGFAVVDYTRVDPRLGTWEEIRSLSERFRLMVDAVINHVSSQNAWLQAFLAGDPRYQETFIALPPETDLSQVVRPRALPLLTPFSTSAGEKYLWTTFSADQVDLNYASPRVLLDIVKVLLQYVREGAQLIRLDAIAYLWKEVGTACIHLPQTHAVIRFFRAVLDQVAPYVLLITETNVPHSENMSYFGGGTDEAQLVYNFALPPLVLHTLLTGSSQALQDWAFGLSLPSRRVTFLNFLASHDGVGLNPVRGILSPAEIDYLVTAARAHGGLVGYKSEPGGGESPYELNINYFDALNPPGGDPLGMQINRFMAAQASLLCLQGLPAIYVHSLFGSRGWPEGARSLGYNRAINRQKFDRRILDAELSNPQMRRAQVYARYARLLQARASEPAFDPYAGQEILPAGSGIFAVLRLPSQGGKPVLCLHNITREPQVMRLAGIHLARSRTWTDCITGEVMEDAHTGRISLSPYQVRWLVPGGENKNP